MDLILPLAIVNLAFLLLAARMILARSWQGTRTRREWTVDILCLLQQGLLVPIFQTAILLPLYLWVRPTFHGRVELAPVYAFLLGFAGIDYLYYWNHRLLHSERFWKWHSLHHSTRHLDFLATSRNSLLTPAFLIYLWGGSLAVFLLADPKWFLIASALGAGLDLWRHSGMVVARENFLFRVLGSWLTLPQDHSWHHSADQHGKNFAANLILWDRWHGTYFRPEHLPMKWGASEAAVDWSRFLWPSHKS